MQYSTYADLPALAGLCNMERAIHAKWSVEESVERQKRLHYVLKRLAEIFTARITNEPIYELKMVFSHHAYLCSEHVTMIRQRVAEMREPPLGLDRCPHEGLASMMEELLHAPTGELFVFGTYGVLVPAMLESLLRLQQEAHPLADAPTVRMAKLIRFEIEELERYGKAAMEALANAWIQRSGRLLKTG